jgi:hypothetical protein
MPFAAVGSALGVSAGTAALGTAVLGGSLISAYASGDAADTAAEASGRASDASIAEQRRQYDISRADQAPYLAAGTGAVNRLGAGVAAGGEFGAATPFDFQYDQNTDPGYAFRFSEGMKGLERSAAARGGLLSGATLKGVQRYGQDMGSQEYQNAFNRYLTGFNANTGERNQLYNRLAGVAGTGQTATSQIGTQGTNMASNIGNAYMNSAANTGNAAMAAAGQRTSAFGGAANVLGRMYGPQRGTNPYGGGGGFYDPSFGYNQTENFDYYGSGYSP